MQNLSKLWLTDAKFKGEWLSHISALPKLKELNLMRWTSTTRREAPDRRCRPLKT